MTKRDRIVILIWIVLIFFLTGLGALPLLYYHVDPSTVSQSSSSVVFAGIELTAAASTLSALLVAFFVPGGGGLRTLFRQLLRVRIGITWYLLALVSPIVLFLLADALFVALGGKLSGEWIVMPSGFGLALLAPLLIIGSFFEELGWRGFGLPRLQQGRFGALWASVLIGVIWSAWHLWPAIASGGAQHLTVAVIVSTFVRLISISVVFSWMYNSTKGSLFLMMGADGGYNIAYRIISTPVDSDAEISLIVAILYLAMALIVIGLTQPSTLARNKLISHGEVSKSGN